MQHIRASETIDGENGKNGEAENRILKKYSISEYQKISRQ